MNVEVNEDCQNGREEWKAGEAMLWSVRIRRPIAFLLEFNGEHQILTTSGFRERREGK